MLEDEQGLADVGDLGDGEFELEDLREHDFEHLLHIDGVRGRREDQRRLHRLGVLARELIDFFDLLGGQRCVHVELRAH